MTNTDVCFKAFRPCSFLLLCASPSWRRKQDKAQLVMFLSILTTGDQSLSLTELEHTMQGLAGGLGFLFWEQRQHGTSRLSDLRVLVYIPKRGISKPVTYNTKGLRICFRRWFNMSAIVWALPCQCAAGLAWGFLQHTMWLQRSITLQLGIYT